MAALLPLPEVQLIDANGRPMVGASIYTYIPSSSTPKATWSEPTGTALNTNPVITDASGRAILYGDGDYRLLVRDANGNEIYDQPSSTLVSAAMQPVMSAPTIADAVELLGISDLIATEAAARAAADSAEQTARIAADNTLTTNLAAEVTRAEAEEASLQTQIDALSGGGGVPTVVQGGVGNATGGHVRVTFSPPYTGCISCVASAVGADYTPITLLLSFDNTGADIYIDEVATGPASTDVTWMAIGFT